MVRQSWLYQLENFQNKQPKYPNVKVCLPFAVSRCHLGITCTCIILFLTFYDQVKLALVSW